MDAEDRAIGFLATLPGQVAAITAVKAAIELTSQWEVEMREMIRRDDPRSVYRLTSQEFSSLYSLAANYCQDPVWKLCPVDDLKRFLTCLPPDTAAVKAFTVAEWACSRLR
jgi:hypothetical protein